MKYFNGALHGDIVTVTIDPEHVRGAAYVINGKITGRFEDPILCEVEGQEEYGSAYLIVGGVRKLLIEDGPGAKPAFRVTHVEVL